jgi:hypothetical protein
MDQDTEALASKLYDELKDGEIAGTGTNAVADTLLNGLLDHLQPSSEANDIHIPAGPSGEQLVLVRHSGAWIASAGHTQEPLTIAETERASVPADRDDPLVRAEQAINRIRAIDF